MGALAEAEHERGYAASGYRWTIRASLRGTNRATERTPARYCAEQPIHGFSSSELRGEDRVRFLSPARCETRAGYNPRTAGLSVA
jgi:hypothetical protein